jgi:prepilin-type N-terminal cleavage/methylation domain-containing protein
MRHRRGVTLIELLVVIAIITILATLIVAVAPRFGERQRSSRGAAQLQSWLNLAKQRALRDQRPVGIRLPAQAATTANANYIRELQYVETPDESIGGVITVPYPTTPPNYKLIQLTTTAQFTPDNPAGSHPEALLQAGDVILIPGNDPRRLVAVAGPTASGGAFTYQLTLDKALTPTAMSTTAYRVSRTPRPLTGEPVLQLPNDIAIDISQEKPSNPSWYRLYPPANTGGNGPFDILFAPSGQVVGFSGVSRICLWVRDVSLPDPGPGAMPPGENTLITIYTRTGHVTAHPVCDDQISGTLTPGSTWNPFKFTQDGLSSSQ